MRTENIKLSIEFILTVINLLSQIFSRSVTTSHVYSHKKHLQN